jgi:hypothetical protein
MALTLPSSLWEKIALYAHPTHPCKKELLKYSGIGPNLGALLYSMLRDTPYSTSETTLAGWNSKADRRQARGCYDYSTDPDATGKINGKWEEDHFYLFTEDDFTEDDFMI